MAIYREVQFELVNGKAATRLFQALSAERTARARLQSMSVGAQVVSVLIDYTGPVDAVTRVRAVAEEPPGDTILDYDTLVDEPKHIRFLATWRRPEDHDRQGVSLEHILYDTIGPSGLLFGRVENGIISYKAASPSGRDLGAFLEAAQTAFGDRFTVRPIRAGPFRTGWEIDDARRRVDPDEKALLSTALAAGYYDEPKRCGVRELGDVLGLSKSVIARRLRILERRALEQLVH